MPDTSPPSRSTRHRLSIRLDFEYEQGTSCPLTLQQDLIDLALQETPSAITEFTVKADARLCSMSVSIQHSDEPLPSGKPVSLRSA